MSGNYTMEINQGADFKLSLTIKDSTGTPIDLTGQTFRGQIRKTASSSSVEASFSFTVLDQVASTGRVDVELPAADSTAIRLDTSKSSNKTISKFAYDIESEDGSGKVVRWLEGIARISPEVTK